MKDYSNFCHCVFSASPSRVFINHTWGGCRFGYRGFNFLCKKCKNRIEPHKYNNLQEANKMENKIYNDDVERIVNDPERQEAIKKKHCAKNQSKKVARQRKMYMIAFSMCIVCFVFALFQILGLMSFWMAVPVELVCGLCAAFEFGRWFENGKCCGWPDREV